MMREHYEFWIAIGNDICVATKLAETKIWQKYSKYLQRNTKI